MALKWYVGEEPVKVEGTVDKKPQIVSGSIFDTGVLTSTGFGPSDGSIYDLRMIRVHLGTSAVVADRRLNFRIKNPSGTLFTDISNIAQVASQNGYYSWAIGVNSYATSSPLSIEIHSLPDIIFYPGTFIQLGIENGQVGDSLDLNYYGYQYPYNGR